MKKDRKFELKEGDTESDKIFRGVLLMLKITIILVLYFILH